MSRIRVRVSFSDRTKGLESLGAMLSGCENRVQSAVIVNLLRRAMAMDGSEDFVRLMTGSFDDELKSPMPIPQSSRPEVVKKVAVKPRLAEVPQAYAAQDNIQGSTATRDFTGIDLDQANAIAEIL